MMPLPSAGAPTCRARAGVRLRLVSCMARLALCLAGLCTAAGAASAASPPGPDGVNGFYRQPALRGAQIVFVAEGDLWRVGSEGGRAERLTTHPGQEGWPALSPDGRQLAFVASYDGSADAYVMPTTGGVPRRLTWEGGGVRVWGFAATGEVIVSVPERNGHPTTQLQAVDPRTLARRLLPVAQAIAPRKFAEILAVMTPAAAERLTLELARSSRGGGPLPVTPAAVSPLPPGELPAIAPPKAP